MVESEPLCTPAEIEANHPGSLLKTREPHGTHNADLWNHNTTESGVGESCIAPINLDSMGALRCSIRKSQGRLTDSSAGISSNQINAFPLHASFKTHRFEANDWGNKLGEFRSLLDVGGMILEWDDVSALLWPASAIGEQLSLKCEVARNV